MIVWIRGSSPSRVNAAIISFCGSLARYRRCEGQVQSLHPNRGTPAPPRARVSASRHSSGSVVGAETAYATANCVLVSR